MSLSPEPTVHFRWDLDKTYLRTDFDSFRDVVRTFRQSAEEKEHVPGAATLLRELLQDEGRRVTFISGSPRQMHKVLSERLALDGITPTAFILKPNLKNLLLLRFKALRGQVGYKLRALLESQTSSDNGVLEALFGDDAERDAFIYSLYADLVEGRVALNDLPKILDKCDVYRGDQARILELAEQVRPKATRVARIFIHLDRRSPVSRFDAYGPRLVPIYNYFQAALVLFGLRMLGDTSILRITADLQRAGYAPTTLANSLQDLLRREALPGDVLASLGEVMARFERALGGVATAFGREFRAALKGISPPEMTQRDLDLPIDYLRLAQEHARYKAPLRGAQPFRWLRL